MKKLVLPKIPVFFFACLVFLISFFTYFRNYSHPPNLFWDENYHIASAQKYLDHTFFMEPHPPLGKLFIALGEFIIHPNTKLDTSNFFNDRLYNRRAPRLFLYRCQILSDPVWISSYGTYLRAVVFFELIITLYCC